MYESPKLSLLQKPCQVSAIDFDDLGPHAGNLLHVHNSSGIGHDAGYGAVFFNSVRDCL